MMKTNVQKNQFVDLLWFGLMILLVFGAEPAEGTLRSRSEVRQEELVSSLL